jgi:hypothetical protein
MKKVRPEDWNTCFHSLIYGIVKLMKLRRVSWLCEFVGESSIPQAKFLFMILRNSSMGEFQIHWHANHFSSDFDQHCGVNWKTHPSV